MSWLAWNLLFDQVSLNLRTQLSQVLPSFGHTSYCIVLLHVTTPLNSKKEKLNS